jgi:hypothetical protein
MSGAADMKTDLTDQAAAAARGRSEGSDTNLYRIRERFFPTFGNLREVRRDSRGG